MPRTIPKREGIMLAYHTDPGKVSRLGQEFYAQPKLNGERCRVEWFQGEPVLLSSYNNPFPHLQHIKDVLIKASKRCGVEIPYDGELYIHNWPRERIHSAVSSPVNYNPDNEAIEFHVFDTADIDQTQEARLAAAHLSLRNFADTKVQLIRTLLVVQINWVDAANEYLDLGFEGMILRKKGNIYTPKRTVSMLKFKPTENDTYRIVGVLEAISILGEPKAMVGAFMVEDSDGNSFKVGAGKLTHDKRTEYWKHRERLLGRLLSVKHEKLRTTNNIPVSAVAVDLLQS